MNKKILIFCAIILIVGIYWVVFNSSGQVVTLTILHLNDSESQLLHAGKGIEDFGGAARGGDQYPFRDLRYINLCITYQDALGNYIRQGLGGVITAIDYPEGGKGRIARLPDTNSP